MTERRRMTTAPQMATTEGCRCKHYRGLLNARSEPCAAGVNIPQLIGNTDMGWALKIPCVYHEGPPVISQEARVPCDRFQTQTAREKAEEEEFFAKQIERMMLAADTVDAFRSRHKRQNAKETVDCPTGCGGRLTMSIAACNGHVWGRCSTAGCLAWME